MNMTATDIIPGYLPPQLDDAFRNHTRRLGQAGTGRKVSSDRLVEAITGGCEIDPNARTGWGRGTQYIEGTRFKVGDRHPTEVGFRFEKYAKRREGHVRVWTKGELPGDRPTPPVEERPVMRVLVSEWRGPDKLRPLLEAGLEYARECLAHHESALGRTTRRNAAVAKVMDEDIAAFEAALKGMTP